MKRRILLTGVTGFLGSHLARALLADGHEVVALKRKSSSLRRIKNIASEILFYDLEGLDFDLLFCNCGKIDVIIHTATCYGRNDESVSEIFHANTEFPLQLLDSGSRAGVEVFVNTDTILDKYLNLYSLSKNQFLQWGNYFAKHNNIRFINIRLEHFYGPDDDPIKFSTFVIMSCLSNISELKLTKGEQKRDFIYIDDVVSAYMISLNNLYSYNENFVEFDLGTGRAVSIRHFVELVHRLSASTTNLSFGSLPYRDGEIMYSEANISRLTALGWSCKTNLEQGIKLAIGGYLT